MKFLILSLLLSSVAYSIPVHSKVETKLNAEKNLLEFKLVPDSGLVLNSEGPWKVEIVESKTEFKKKTATKSDFDLKTGSVSLEPTKKPEKGSSAKYKFIGFVCTADKTKCFRDVHSGEVKF